MSKKIIFESDIDEVLKLIKEELQRANKKFNPVFNSPHEGFAVLKEEVDELWDDVKNNDIPRSILECIQVGAMAVKYLVNFRNNNIL